MKDVLGRWLLKQRLQAVRPHLKGRLLDIGCGTNRLCRTYPGQGLGLDVRQWGDVDLVVENSADLPFPDRSFDTVTCLAALNHIPNRREVLGAAFRVLRPGGGLLVTMIPPLISRVWHFLRQPWDADQVERGVSEGEVYGLTPAEMRGLIRAAGFEMVREEPFMLGINRLYVARRPLAG